MAVPTLLRMHGARAILEDVVERILRARAQEVKTGATPQAMVLVFDSPTDPTFLHYQSMSDRDGGPSFEVGGIEFRVLETAAAHQ